MSPARVDRPARQVCQVCVRDDSITVDAIGPGLWRYTCSNRRRHPDYKPWPWLSTATDKLDEEATDDLASELGLYDDLPQCIIRGEPFVEYGIVEHRYSQHRPKVYGELVDKYGHTRQGPKRYTASAFIAAALGRMAARGEVLYQEGRATGYWAYNGTISYWALPPGPAQSDPTLTYNDYAKEAGIDPLA
jgi:hypothetical protein